MRGRGFLGQGTAWVVYYSRGGEPAGKEEGGQGKDKGHDPGLGFLEGAASVGRE